MKIRLLVIALVALVCAACQVDAQVDVVVTEDGSGTVTVTALFDPVMVERVPELATGLRTADLEAAGWDVEVDPNAEPAGSVQTVASKPFESPDHLHLLLDEIVGEDLLFEDFKVSRERTFARTTYQVTGTIDPLFSFTTFGDEEVTGLVGAPLGVSLAEMEALAERPLEETVSLVFTVTLPDTAESTTGDARGNTVTWNIAPTDPLPTGIEASSSVEDTTPRAWAAVALVALALLATLLVFRILASFGGRRSDKGAEDEFALRRPDKPSETAAAPETEQRPPRLELVVLDARGVLYDEANEVGARLVPFVRERGSKASLQEINDAYRSASLGRLSTSELWTILGVEGEAAELDEEYTSEYRLREGVLDFIDRLHERGLRVAVITNNVLGWSKMLRKRFDLDAHVDTWVASGEIGCRKPDAAFFEALRRMSGVDYRDSLLIDDQLDDLDMAKSLSMSTAMFVPSSSQLPSSSAHPVVHGFESFFGQRKRTESE